MNAGARRVLAVASGCLAGIGLGSLVSILIDIGTISIRENGGSPVVSGSLWPACLAIGLGLGAAFAAVIPDDPKRDQE